MPGYAEEIRMEKGGGVYFVPVVLNHVLKLDFIVDSGASDVSIPPEVVLTLCHSGEIDFLPGQTYILADGSQVKSDRFVIRSLQLGKTTLQNVQASISPVGGPLLLGQSCLSRLGKWSIDSDRGIFSFIAPGGDGTGRGFDNPALVEALFPNSTDIWGHPITHKPDPKLAHQKPVECWRKLDGLPPAVFIDLNTVRENSDGLFYKGKQYRPGHAAASRKTGFLYYDVLWQNNGDGSCLEKYRVYDWDTD